MRDVSEHRTVISDDDDPTTTLPILHQGIHTRIGDVIHQSTARRHQQYARVLLHRGECGVKFTTRVIVHVHKRRRKASHSAQPAEARKEPSATGRLYSVVNVSTHITHDKDLAVTGGVLRCVSRPEDGVVQVLERCRQLIARRESSSRADWVVELREPAIIHHVPVPVLRYRDERVRWCELVVSHVLGDRWRRTVHAILKVLNVTTQNHLRGERIQVEPLRHVK
ncbi:hypothetical protein D3C86_1301920 [compost metagenome]